MNNSTYARFEVSGKKMELIHFTELLPTALHAALFDVD
jgi:hypothetical protein